MKYRDAYPQSLSSGDGLIYSISSIDKMPWFESDDEFKQNLERLYCTRSGFKDVIETFLLVPESKRAALISALFSDKWIRLWSNFKLAYNPLHAYTMNEKTKSTKTISESESYVHGKEVNVTENNSGTVSNAGSKSDNGTDSVFGFNSSDSVPASTESATSSTNDTETRDLQNTTHTEYSGTDTQSNNSTDTDEISIEKNGNIGYTTPQELIRQEFEIWGTPFFNIVFEDIDQFITLKVFSLVD